MGVVVGVYRLALAAITFVALFWSPSGGLSLDIEDYVYFTNQSNLLLAVVMTWGGVTVLARRHEPPPWLWGAVTLFLLITGLVSYLILDPAPPGEEVIQRCRELTGRRGGFDVAFECSGAQAALPSLFEALRREATLVTVGHPSRPAEINIAAYINKKGITLRGIFGRRLREPWEQTLLLLD